LHKFMTRIFHLPMNHFFIHSSHFSLACLCR
jgi:hypothetical protein